MLSRLPPRGRARLGAGGAVEHGRLGLRRPAPLAAAALAARAGRRGRPRPARRWDRRATTASSRSSSCARRWASLPRACRGSSPAPPSRSTDSHVRPAQGPVPGGVGHAGHHRRLAQEGRRAGAGRRAAGRGGEREGDGGDPGPGGGRAAQGASRDRRHGRGRRGDRRGRGGRHGPGGRTSGERSARPGGAGPRRCRPGAEARAAPRARSGRRAGAAATGGRRCAPRPAPAGSWPSRG